MIGEFLRVVWQHRRHQWWRRPPFVPVPSRSHLVWRLETAYGRVAWPTLKDLRSYLIWHRSQRRARSGIRSSRLDLVSNEATTTNGQNR